MPLLLPKLPPGADIVFRRLFDDENKARLLISLLNAILRYPPGALIQSLTLRPTHLKGPLAVDKEVVLDVRAEAQNGNNLHIEVQSSGKPSYAERILFYWAQLFAGQLESGKGYVDLCPVISVHFLFFDLLEPSSYPSYHHVFRARADGDGAVLSPHFELHTLEMKKFAEQTEGNVEEKWLYFLKHGHQMTSEQIAALGVPEIAEAERKLTMISQSRDLRVQFERRRKAELDAFALTHDSLVVGRREGRAEGRVEGRAEGRAEGRVEGRAEGRAEGMDAGKRLGIDEGTNLGKQQAGRDAVLQVLAARGLTVSDAVRAHITAETNLQVLQSWLTRACVASRAEELLDS